MARINSLDLERSVTDSRVGSRIIILYGDNDDLKADLFKSVRRSLNVPLDDPFRFVNLDSSAIDADPARLSDELGAISMFGGSRLIRATLIPRQCSLALQQALQAPSGEWVLVIETGDVADATWIEAVEGVERVALVACGAESAGDFHSFVRREFERAGIVNDAGAIDALILLVGDDRSAVRGEIEKLQLLSGGSAPVTGEVVRNVVADASSMLADEIANSALIGEPELVVPALDRMNLIGSDLIQAVGAALRQALNLHRAKTRQWGARQGSRDANLTAAELRSIIRLLSAAVLQTRSGGNATLHAERALLSLASATRRRKR